MINYIIRIITEYNIDLTMMYIFILLTVNALTADTKLGKIRI